MKENPYESPKVPSDGYHTQQRMRLWKLIVIFSGGIFGVAMALPAISFSESAPPPPDVAIKALLIVYIGGFTAGATITWLFLKVAILVWRNR